MNEKARTSWLLVPASDDKAVVLAAESGAHVIVLDLAELVAAENKAYARDKMRTAVATAAVTGAEVFAQIDPELFDADLRACVWPGLDGLVVSRAESPRHIADVAALLDHLETERRLRADSLRIVAALETGRGNHAAYEICHCSPRLWGVTLGRADLVMDLRPEPSGEIHLMTYLMQRLILIAGAAGATPLGAWWRAPDRGLLATPENTYAAARRGRAIGFKGAMCLRANQVEPLRRGFAS